MMDINEMSLVSWFCMGHNPTIWQYGQEKEGMLYPWVPISEITRLDSGRWHWHVGDIHHGSEPSRTEAMVAAMNTINVTEGYLVSTPYPQAGRDAEQGQGGAEVQKREEGKTMNINEMSDEEKSVMLARLVGWEVKNGGALKDYLTVICAPGKNILVSINHNLYTSDNMALAWDILGWSLKVKPTDPAGSVHAADRFHNKMRAWLYANGYLWGDEKAQRAWLDKILQLAIDQKEGRE